MAVLGIDPGITGAYALFDPTKSTISGLRWVVHDIPTLGDEQRELNAATFYSFLRRYAPEHAFLERVTAMPSIVGKRSMGTAGAFRFGGVFYALKAVLACAGIPVTLVVPSVWKKSVGLKGSDKEQSRKRAIELFPEQATDLCYKKDQNRAEAMLLAYYGANK